MTQFKDKSEEAEFISAGLYTYPVLQAADILAYRAKYVPVGKDQEQHLELSRSIARRFNQTFGKDFFPEPQPLFTTTPRIMSLADPTKKMSKSAGERHYVGLFEDEQSIRKKLKSAVTDSGDLPEGVYMSPGLANLFEILRACGKSTAADDLDSQYRDGKLRYVDLKDQTADALVELSGRLKSRRDDLLKNADYVETVIRKMTERARDIVRETLRDARDIVGLPRLDA
jgi:tryptophanyl-tRNA synthetase